MWPLCGSVMGQPTRPTQPTIPPTSVNVLFIWITGWRPLNVRPGLRIVVWLQFKVRGRGLYARSVCLWHKIAAAAAVAACGAIWVSHAYACVLYSWTGANFMCFTLLLLNFLGVSFYARLRQLLIQHTTVGCDENIILVWNFRTIERRAYNSFRAAVRG